MKTEYETLNDGCEGDSEGLRAALGDAYVVVYEDYDAEGWGHHGANAVFIATDGRLIGASCGGCSCGGSGGWSYCATGDEALASIPEQDRERIPPEVMERIRRAA